MSKQEEREDIIEELAMVLCHIDGRYWNDLTLIEASDYKKKTELVCLKVDRELPHPWRDDCMSAHSEACKTCDNCEILEWAQFDLIEAGYVATEPLI